MVLSLGVQVILILSLGIPFLRVGDVTGKTDNAVFTNSDNVVLVTDSDLLLTLDGSPGYVRTGLQGAISSGIRKVETIDPKKVSLSWLRFCLQSHEIQETIQRHTTGITILHAALSSFTHPNPGSSPKRTRKNRRDFG